MHLGTLWELGNLSLSLPPLKKKKKRNWIIHECHAEPSHCLHELSISKTVGHQFWPGLMARAEIWGHSEKRMHLRPTP
jgi:transcriptional regulator of acetoin/glycerol metabolism